LVRKFRSIVARFEVLWYAMAPPRHALTPTKANSGKTLQPPRHATAPTKARQAISFLKR
jgi:hypothetical protein